MRRMTSCYGFPFSHPTLALERRLPPEKIRDYDASTIALSAEAAGAQQVVLSLVWIIQTM